MSSGFTSIHQDDSPDSQRCPLCEHPKDAHYEDAHYGNGCKVKGCKCTLKQYTKIPSQIAQIRADEIDWDEEGIKEDIETEKFKNEKGENPVLHDFRLTVEENGKWMWEVEKYQGTWTPVADGYGEYMFSVNWGNKNWKISEESN